MIIFACVKVQIMGVNFYLTNKDKEKTSIYVVVRFKSERYKKAVGESIETKYWNDGWSREVKDYPHGKAINKKLKKLKNACEGVCDKHIEDISIPDEPTFWKEVDLELTGKTKEYTFLDYFADYIEQIRHKFKENTIISYETSLSKLKKYQEEKKTTLKFESINIAFYNSLQAWVYGQGQSANYFGCIVKHVKKVYKEARKAGHHRLYGTSDDEFISIKLPSDAVYLNEKELLAIYNLEFSAEKLKELFPDIDKKPQNLKNKIKSYTVVRNKFLIGGCTALRVSDYNRLNECNVSSEFVRIKPQKVGEEDVVIPMHWMMKEILESGFDISTPISDQKINEHIKEICHLAGITQLVQITRNEGGKKVPYTFKKYELVTTHTCRRSGATNMYKAGIPTLSIMKITGHKSERDFLKYIKISAEENAELLKKHDYFTKRIDEREKEE